MAFTQEMRDKAAETRRKNAEIRRNSGAVPVSSGVGESKRFGGDYRPADVVLKEEELLDCHLGGKLIRDLDLPPHVLANLSYQQTDEAIAERNAGRSEHRIEVGAGPEDKERDQYRDNRAERHMPAAAAKNPMQERIKRHIPPGMHGKFLSPNRKGVEDLDGYEPVMDDKGQPVKYKRMTLGMIPESEARARSAANTSKDRNRIKQTELIADERRARMQRGQELPSVTPGVGSSNPL